MLKISPGTCLPLYGTTETRQIEQFAQVGLPPNTLMQRAGLASAQLAMAIAPHARRIWVACGPGNNGGDGLEAAMHLQRWGKQPVITWLGTPESVPPDTQAAYQRLMAAEIAIASDPLNDFDLCIDALLGIGAQSREPRGQMANWIECINAGHSCVLSVDIPSGLDARTGMLTQLHVKASHTLSLLTLKPGLFTAQGRDASGSVWLDALGVDSNQATGPSPIARLLPQPVCNLRSHGSHKGSYGDVAVIGGTAGMTGAALLAASAALHAGAGRVFVGLLDGGSLVVNTQQPELMFRAVNALDLSTMTLVCGCGGGEAVRAILPRVLSVSAPIVIDADAINAIASDGQLQALLINRGKTPASAVLTPHPLEAARLLDCTVVQVQADRLAAAQTLSARFGCTVVLKGSGSIISSPGQIPMINPTGNARLATAGTGDVLAGMIGAQLAAGKTGFEAASHAVYLHGQQADDWPASHPLTAGQLAQLRLCCPDVYRARSESEVLGC